jgi:hypothetical protein
MMVPTVPLVGGSILSVVFPVVFGLVLAFLAGVSVAAMERRALVPATVREEQRRRREQYRRPVPSMARAA